MLNTLKRKIALVAVSAVGMSGLALMSAPAANAVVTGLTSMTNSPTRNSTLAGNGIGKFSSDTGTAAKVLTDNAVVVSVIGTSDTTGALVNSVVGETATLRAVVISAPTAAVIDSTSAIKAGDTLAAVGYLKSGVASSFTLATTGDSVTLTTLALADGLVNPGQARQGMHSKAFRTAGSYVVDVWVDFSGSDAVLTSGNNNSVGESVLRATISIGGSPTKMALSATSATNAGTSGSAVGVTLKDASDVPTLLASHLNESMTVRTTLGSTTTETVTVRRGTALAFNNGVGEGDSVTVQTRVVGSWKTANFDLLVLPSGQSLVVTGAGESITASTGSYDYRVNNTGAMLSTIGFNLTHAPLAADLTFAFSTAAGAEAKTIKVTNASGVHQESTTALGDPVATGFTNNNEVYTAPTSIETATRVNYQVNPTVTTVGLAITGTAAAVVNVTISGSTTTGVTNGTTQVTLDALGAGTINFTGTAPATTNTYTVTIAESASGTANLSTILVFTYTLSQIATKDWGKNGISSNLLSKDVVAAGVAIGATTSIKVTVKDQYGTPQQYVPVKGFLSPTSRNVANVFTTQYTDAAGTATVTLTDVSTSTTSLTDVLQVGVAALQSTTFDRITATKDIITLTYSASGAYASLAVTGGTTSTVTKTVPVETADAHAAAEVTLVPSLLNAAGTAVTGVALTYTATDGVFFRKAAVTRPTTGDLKTVTAGSSVSVFAYGTKPGVATVTITGGGQTATATFTVAKVIASTARSISATTAAGRVTATVTDGWGNPIAGATVSFAADNKGIFGSGVSSTSALTDASGLASAVVLSADGTAADVVVITTITGAQQADLVDSPVTGFAAGVASATITAKTTAASATTDTAITAVKTDVATANAAVKALATQVTVLQASVATLIDSLTTQIASLLKSVSALTKAVAKLQAATKKK